MGALVSPAQGIRQAALVDHLRWYAKHFGEAKPEWFVFPGGSRFPKDPTRLIGSLKTAWNNVRKKAGVSGRWHDNRHTLITELAENGAGDETIMEIAGHVSRQMLSRYAHIRTDAKRKALERWSGRGLPSGSIQMKPVRISQPLRGRR